MVKAINRLSSQQNGTPDVIWALITDYFVSKGKTSLNPWPVSKVVRAALPDPRSISSDDLQYVENQIRLKETMPGTKVSPMRSSPSRK